MIKQLCFKFVCMLLLLPRIVLASSTQDHIVTPIMATTIVTDSSATVTWHPCDGANSYLVYWDGAAYASLTDTSITFVGLDANRRYVGSIAAVGNNDTSSATVFSFITLCSGRRLPFVDDFETDSGSISSCWTILEWSRNSPSLTTDWSHSGSYALDLNARTNRISIASPRIMLPANEIDVVLWAAKYNFSYTDHLVVGFMTDLNDLSTMIPVDTIIPQIRGQRFAVSFANIGLTDTGYVFLLNLGGAFGNLYVDDVEIRRSRSCEFPQDLSYLSSTHGQVTVQIHDTLHTAWEQAVGEEGFDPQSLINYVATDSLVVTLTGLCDSLSYDVYVRALCGDSYSYWTGPLRVRPNIFVMDIQSNETIRACGVTILDDGGLNGYYRFAQLTRLTIYPEHEGDFVALSGMVDLHIMRTMTRPYSYANLEIHDGATANGTLLASCTGGLDTVSVVSSEGPITITFTSSGINWLHTSEGFELYAYCLPGGLCMAPRQVRVDHVEGNAAMLHWENPSTDGPAGWTIVVEETNGSDQQVYYVADTSQSFFIRGLQPRTSYRVTISANCDSSSSSEQTVYFSTTCVANGGVCQVGTGVEDCTFYPLNLYSPYSFCQMIVPFDEIERVSDMISGIEFDNTTNVNVNVQAELYIDTTHLLTLEQGYVPPTANAAHATVQLHNVGSTMTFPLDQEWMLPSDSSNLIVTLMSHNSYYRGTAMAHWLCENNHPFTVLHASADSLTNLLQPSGMYISSVRPNMRFIFPCPDPGCTAPVVVASHVDYNSITIEWASGYDEQAWHIDYKTQEDSVWSVAEQRVTSTVYTFEGLAPSTTYQFRVGSLCANDEIVYREILATTPCAPLEDLPLFEDFEYFSDGTDATIGFEPCWDHGCRGTSNGTRRSMIPPYDADWSMQLSASPIGQVSSWLVLPELAYNIDTIVLRFSLRGRYSYQSHLVLIVGVMENPSRLNSFEPIDTLEYNSFNVFQWDEIEISLANYRGNGHRIAFLAPYTGTGCFIDNLEVDFRDACPHPTDFHVSTLTRDCATLQWSDTAQVGDYWLLLGSMNNLTMAIDSVHVTDTNQYTFTGLSSGSTYWARIFTHCDSSQSRDVNLVFTTLLRDPLPLPLYCDFESSHPFELAPSEGVFNQWCVGSAVAYGSGSSLYVSHDSLHLVNSYINYESRVFAYTPLALDVDSTYAYSFDWRCRGAEDHAGFRAMLIPATFNFNNLPFYYEANFNTVLPSGWIALNDGMIWSNREWNYFSGVVDVPRGSYFLAFLWDNDSDIPNNPAAAIDNITFDLFRCAEPTGVQLTQAEPHSLHINWNNDPEVGLWQLEYGPRGYVRGTGTSVTCTNPSAVLNGLDSITYYDVWIRAFNQNGDTSLWTKSSFATALCHNENVAQNFNSESATCVSELAPSVYPYSIAKMLIRASDLEHGGIGDAINAIAIDALTPDEGYYFSDCNVYMANTSRQTISSSAPYIGNNYTQVISHGDLSYSHSGWEITEFDTPFLWDGVSNVELVIYRCQGHAGSLPAQFAGHTASGQTLYFDYSSDPLNLYAAPRFLTTPNIPNIRFYSCVSSCSVPTFDSILVDHQSAYISWRGVGESYDVSIREAADPEWHIDSTVNDTSVSFFGLYPDVNYQVRVRQHCNEYDQSAYNVASFTTSSWPCLAPLGVEIVEGTNNSVLLDWTPAGYERKWRIHAFNTSFNQTLDVDTHPARFEGLVPGVSYRIAVAPLCGSDLNLGDYSDTLLVTTVTCDPIMSLSAEAVVGCSNIDVSIIPGQNNSGLWEIMYGFEGFGNGQHQGSVIVDCCQYRLTNLEGLATYDIYVRAVCAEGWYSNWSPKVTVTTNEKSNAIGIVEAHEQFTLSPNPAQGQTLVTVSLEALPAQMVLFDELGTSLLHVKLTQEETILPLTNYADGVYFVQVINSKWQSIKKLVVR